MSLTPEQKSKILKENPRKFVSFGSVRNLIDYKKVIKDPESNDDDGDEYIPINHLIECLQKVKKENVRFVGDWMLDHVDLFCEERESEYRARIKLIEDIATKKLDKDKIGQLNFPMWKKNKIREIKSSIENLDLPENVKQLIIE